MQEKFTRKNYEDVRVSIWTYSILIGYGLLFYIFGFDFFFNDDGQDWKVFGLFVLPLAVAKVLDVMALRSIQE